MLGFAWMLRNEAARVLRKWGRREHVQASVDVFRVAHAACQAAIDQYRGWFHPQDSVAALAILTSHNAEECLRRRRHMDVIIMDDVTSSGSVTPEMQEKIKQWYTTMVDSAAPGDLTKGETE